MLGLSAAAAERGATEEGLAPHQHCQVFTGHRQISRSLVGVKCHLPSQQSPLPPSLLCKEGLRPRVSWASKDQLVPKALLLVPKSHQLLPTPRRQTALQGAARPVLALAASSACCGTTEHLPIQTHCWLWQSTLSQGTRAGTSCCPYIPALSRRDAVGSMSSLLSGRGGWMSLGAIHQCLWHRKMCQDLITTKPLWGTGCRVD